MPPSAQDEMADVFDEMNSTSSETEAQEDAGNFLSQEQRDNREFLPSGNGFTPPNGQTSSASWQSVLVLLGLSVVALLVGLAIAVKYKR